MVRVYIAKFPEERPNHSLQSRHAHRLLEIALERDYPQVCAPFLLEKGEHGKPFLPDYPEIYVNLSHSGPYAACAVGDGPVGIDVEMRRQRRRWERVAGKLHPREREELFMLEEVRRETAFCDLWVLKESFLKADGRGLGVPLDAFYMERKPEVIGKTRLTEKEAVYFYLLYPMGEEACSLAVCSRDPALAGAPVWLSVPEEC